MKFTNVKQLIIKFMGGGIINFPTRFLRWVKINGDIDDSDDGGGEEVMDYKTYCDTVIRNYIEDNAESLGFDSSNVVMPDNYIQIVPGEEETEETIVYDVDYTKPYYYIKAVYNSDLITNVGKIYITYFKSIIDINLESFVPGNRAKTIPISDDYIGIASGLV